MSSIAQQDDEQPQLSAINTPEQVAAFLRVEPRIVNEMARNGRLAGFKPARSWRFTRQAVLDYIKEASAPRPKPRPIVPSPIDGFDIENPWGRRTRHSPRSKRPRTA